MTPWFSFAVILFFLIFGKASAEDLSVGNFSLSQANGVPLETTEPLDQTLGAKPSLDFVSRVGGVAFGAVARPEVGQSWEGLRIFYDPSSDNGRRLVIENAGVKYTPNIYDWQLIPIARFADSHFTGAFTLFGSLSDESFQKEVLNSGARVLSYAPPFVDTLLGLRLFQLDVLLMNDELAIELPKKDGNYLLGAGEARPNTALAAKKRNNYYRALSYVFEDMVNVWQSYVICDCFQDITFLSLDGEFVITGDLFFYFWISDETLSERKAFLEFARSKNIIADDGTYEDFERAFDEMSTIQQSLFINDLNSVLSSLGRRLGQQAVYLEDYSLKRNALNSFIREMNPNVWSAGETAMRYAAFFRFVKEQQPDIWRGFVDQIDELKTRPEVNTPEIMRYPQ